VSDLHVQLDRSLTILGVLDGAAGPLIRPQIGFVADGNRLAPV